MRRSATITAPNDTAFNRKHGPTPKTAMVTPASAGPTTRLLLLIAMLRLMALVRSAGPTRSNTIDDLTGWSNAVMTPSAAAITYTIHSRTEPVTVSRPST